MSTTNISNVSLRKVWQNFKNENPKIRIRDAAKQLGVTEAELVASECDGKRVVKLRPDWKNILIDFQNLGHVMALTRNESAVSEIKGFYKNVKLDKSGGVVLGDKIDLRVFLEPWAFGFFVTDSTKDNPERKSFHFFDKNGFAVHKVYQTAKSNPDQFVKLADKFRSEDQDSNVIVQPLEEKRQILIDDEVNVKTLREGWKSLTDTHEFFGFLKDMNVARLQAFRLVGDDLAQKVSPEKFPLLLNSVVEKKIKLMTFIGNDGMLQIYSDYIENVKPLNEWINILDENFNMHLRQDHIDSAWIVRKKKGNNWIYSFELFDKEGNVIALFFNKKKETESEDTNWLNLIENLKN